MAIAPRSREAPLGPGGGTVALVPERGECGERGDLVGGGDDGIDGGIEGLVGPAPVLVARLETGSLRESDSTRHARLCAMKIDRSGRGARERAVDDPRRRRTTGRATSMRSTPASRQQIWRHSMGVSADRGGHPLHHTAAGRLIGRSVGPRGLARLTSGVNLADCAVGSTTVTTLAETSPRRAWVRSSSPNASESVRARPAIRAVASDRRPSGRAAQQSGELTPGGDAELREQPMQVEAHGAV